MNAPAEGESSIEEQVARDLSGDLHCVQCGYNQRGMSVRAMCPECGLPVLATVLGVVDPQAEQLQPIARPRLVAAGFVVWAVSAMAAVGLVWIIHGLLAAGVSPVRGLAMLSVILVGISGLGALSLVRPHGGIEPRRVAMSALAVGLYLPLVFLHGELLVPISLLAQSPFQGLGGLSLETHLLRLACIVLIVAITLFLRPTARMLAARSLVVRTGRVDRQSMLSLAGALGVAAIGDLIGVVANLSTEIIHGTLAPISLILIGMGSLLFTIGLGGIVLDVLRLAPVILHRPVGVEQAFGEQDGMFE